MAALTLHFCDSCSALPNTTNLMSCGAQKEFPEGGEKIINTGKTKNICPYAVNRHCHRNVPLALEYGLETAAPPWAPVDPWQMPQ
jgi:hypothetical protein